jgi:hypothetical protein
MILANKMALFFFVYIANAIAQNAAQTGAFEIVHNGKVVFSKLENGQLPRLEEIVNGLRRKVYGAGSYALSNMTHENTSIPTPDRRFVELTVPYDAVATGVEAVERADGYNNIFNDFPQYDSISPNGWQTFAWDATNSTWVEMNMDNTRIFPDGSPGTLPTTFREISGNTLSSNKYRVMVCEDSVATRFDGFRIYSKDESPPAIPLGDVIESLIELNTFH